MSAPLEWVLLEKNPNGAVVTTPNGTMTLRTRQDVMDFIMAFDLSSSNDASDAFLALSEELAGIEFANA